MIEQILALIAENYSPQLREYLIHCQVLGHPPEYQDFVQFLRPGLTPQERAQLLPWSLTRMARQKDQHRAMAVAFEQLANDLKPTNTRNPHVKRPN